MKTIKPPKQLFIFLLLTIVSVSCNPFDKSLDKRWVFTDLQTPALKAMANAFDPSSIEQLTIGLRQKIKGNRMILDEKGTCYGVLLNRYFTGKWEAGGDNKEVFVHIDYPQKMNLKWTASVAAYGKSRFDIDASALQLLESSVSDTSFLNEETLAQTEDGELYSVIAESEKYKFTEKDNDPWSPELNKWRLAPNRPESRKEIATRVRNHIYFMYTFFSFILREDRYWVSQDWFFSVIKPGNNGTALYAERNIPADWYRCFYDSTQALSGYHMIRNAFNGNVQIPKAADSFVFNKEMLAEVLRVFDEQNEDYLK